MGKLAGRMVVMLGALSGITALSPARSAAERGTACGAPGKPPCPLQAWMRAKVAAPLANRDLKKLAESLDAVRALNPEPARWTNWERFASEGAQGARGGNESRAMRSCTSCHDVYRARYNELFRERSAPHAGPQAR